MKNINKLSFFVSCLIFVLLICGSASAVQQGNSESTYSHSNILNSTHTQQINKQNNTHSTINSNSNKETKVYDPQIYNNGVPVARGGNPAGYSYNSIADAIAVSLNGDTIMLENNAIFHESNLIITKNLDFKVFNNGNAIIDGGNTTVFTVEQGINFSLQGITIRNGNGRNGGAINSIGGANISLTNCNFLNNYANSSGGAIYNDGGLLNINNCSFTGNTARYNGGAIGDYFGTVSINNSTFTENNANNGGAINNHYANLKIVNCTFIFNSAPNGGAISNDEGIVTINNSDLYKNSAKSGGAIYNVYGTLTIYGTNFLKNSATSGGAIYNSESVFLDSRSFTSVSYTTFKNNTADYGGAIYNADGDLNIKLSEFLNNSANSNGGAIYDSFFKSIISKSIFKNNHAKYGGAIYNGVSDFHTENYSQITGNTFKNNTADYGGAIYNTSLINVISNSFIKNSAKTKGGSFYNYQPKSSYTNSSAKLHYNLFIGNTAPSGKEIYSSGGYVNAIENWWGSNSNPAKKIRGKVSYNPWIVLRVSANHITKKYGQTSQITVDLLHDSKGKYLDPKNHIPDGTAITFKTSWGLIKNIKPISSTTLNGKVTAIYIAKGKHPIPKKSVKVYACVNNVYSTYTTVFKRN